MVLENQSFYQMFLLILLNKFSMFEIDESEKLKKFKCLSSIPVENVINYYKIKKNSNVLIFCDTGFLGKNASARMGKTFYENLKKRGANVSIIVGKANKKTSFVSKKINEAIWSLKKGDTYISLSSSHAPYFHKNNKRVILRKIIDKKGFNVVSTNGLMSLNSKNVDDFFKAFNDDKKETKALGLKLKRLFEKTKKVKVTCIMGI
jgi:hypothetical protein